MRVENLNRCHIKLSQASADGHPTLSLCNAIDSDIYGTFNNLTGLRDLCWSMNYFKLPYWLPKLHNMVIDSYIYV